MKRSIMLIMLGLLWISAAAENALEIVKLSPIEQIEYVSSFTKWKFRNDSIFIYDSSDAVLSQNALAEVRVMIFSEAKNPESIDEIVPEETVLKVFPNPATYQIRVENYEEVHSLRIYTPNGQLVPVVPFIDGSRAIVNVSALTEGTYILLVNQTAFKLIKQ